MVVDHFEGPEKKLELTFALKGTLMQMGADTWQKILDYAQCTILSHTESSTVEAYLLSESSLFVTQNRVMIKTCGTTKLLLCLPEFFKLAKSVDPDYQVLSCSFSRKNYICPHLQPEPHTDFEAEVNYLKQYIPGQAQILGPVDANNNNNRDDEDHWCVYLSDSLNDSGKSEQCLEIMMLDLDPDVMKQYYQTCKQKPVIEESKSHYLGADHVDDFLFEPCGYSVNAVKEDEYFTVHITPNEGHSYVSYETNAQVASHGKLTRSVIDTYRPGRFCVAVKRGEFSPSRREAWQDISFPGYERTDLEYLEHDIHHIVFASFAKKDC